METNRPAPFQPQAIAQPPMAPPPSSFPPGAGSANPALRPPAFADAGVVPSLPSDAPAPRLSPSLSGAHPFPQAEKRTSLLYAFFLIVVLLVGAFGGAYLYQPELVKGRVDQVRVALGLTTEEALRAATGPPFDTQAAGDILGKIALQASQCREPNGPTGKGRAQVLYEPTGLAASVAVSKPFHETSVGTCLIELFKTTAVPAFGGQPVIVTKTFDVR